VAVLLVSAFLVGGASAEVAVRAHDAIEKARSERDVGAAGQLVSLELKDAFGEVVARPRLIAPAGRAAELVLHDPAAPDTVRLALRVESRRQASGEIALAYALWVPGHDVSTRGTVSLVPGVVRAVELDGGTLVGTFFAVPVPSPAFDAYLEAEG
jgi:hypothetical protein